MKKNKKKVIIILVIVLLISIVSLLLIFKDKLFSKETVNNIDINENLTKDEPKVNIVDLDSNSRPFAVMINNLNEARQVQSGLSDAYLVYEIIVEGGITRYLALFKDVDVSRIGSIRSARHYYIDYVLENDAIYVHWGWSPQAQEDIKLLKINNINGLTYEGKYFYRENPISPIKIASEHTGFTNTELLNNAVDKLGYRTETNKGLLLTYSPTSVDLSSFDSVQDANKLKIVYSNYITNTYEYDVDKKVYNRYVNKSEQIDKNTDEPITVKNIIVYSINNYTIAGDSKGRQFLDNIGSGEGYYISEGKIIKINWEKESREKQTKYTYEDGTQLIVNDGNTFIQIIPKTGNISWE
ncbi:MAG: DUF3048 domain-containing protein [Bacilli bacterium]